MSKDKEVKKGVKKKRNSGNVRDLQDDYESFEDNPFQLTDVDEDDENDDVDEINEEEILLATKINEDFEKEALSEIPESNEEVKDKDDDHKKVYKASSKSEQIRQDFVEICKKYNSGDPILKQESLQEAIDELESFVHYVIKKKYSTYRKHYEDLVQEGYIGIIKGMEKYNPEKSLPTTFFNLYIIHEMSKFIDTEVNKTTSHYSSNLTKINRVIDKFEIQSKPWEATDIAVETGLNMETVIQCLNIKEYKNEMYYETPEILEANISERKPGPEQLFIENEKLNVLYKAISTLSPEEIQVLKYRYGLGNTKTISYKEIAKEMDISIEKVRKYRHDAIRKLKHKANIKNIFNEYIPDPNLQLNTQNEVAVIPEEVATAQLNELEELDFNFDDCDE